MVHISRFAALQNDGHGGTLLGDDQMLMHRSHCQQGRNGLMVLIHTPVCQDQDVGPVSVGTVDLHIQTIQCPFQVGVIIIGNGDLCYLKALYLHVLDFQNVRVGQDRVIHLQHLTVFRPLLQQVAVLADVNGGGCDDFLSNSVYRRIGYLGKQLLEIVKQRLMLLGQYGQRCIHTHGGNALCPVLCHGKDGGGQILVGVTEGLLHKYAFFFAVDGDLLVGDFQILQLHQIVIQPFAVGLSCRIALFQFVIVDDLALHRIHQQHFARAETFLCHDPARGQIHDTHLGGEDQVIIVGDIIPGRTQTIAVQYRAHHIAIGEYDGCRAVPGLHHGCEILIEVFLFLGHDPVVGPGLRDGDHDCQRQLHAVHVQEFQRVVQHGGVRTCHVDDRQHLVHLALETSAFHRLFSGQHVVGISADGVDLAVVDDEAVGMCSLPAGVRVGAEPGMHDGDGRFIIGMLQIAEEFPQLVYQEHALVHDGSAGKGYHVGVIVALLKYPAHHVQAAVKIQSLRNVRRSANECLHDKRHTFSGLVSQNLLINGHFSPSQELQPLLGNDDLKHLLCLVALHFLLGEEKHTHAVIPF